MDNRSMFNKIGLIIFSFAAVYIAVLLYQMCRSKSSDGHDISSESVYTDYAAESHSQERLHRKY